MNADLILYNGKVYTVDKNDSTAEAVVVMDNKIVFVGTSDEAGKYAGDDTKTIDLKGRCLIPGIIDSHLHTAVYGANSLALDLRSPGISSIEEIKEKVREAAKTTPKGQWIRGWGYDHSKLREQRHPNRWDLDEAAPDHPVMLTRVCAHISAHNGKSLELAGIKSADMDSKENDLAGVMFENDHMDMMKVASLGKSEIIDAMKAADDLLTKEGITTVHDSGGYGKVQMDAIQEAVDGGKLKLRINAMIFSFVENVKFVEDYLSVGIHTGFGCDRYRLGPLKLMIDGSSSGPTAATKEPYESDKNSRGIMSMESEVIDDIVMRAHMGGWQMTCHAVGDRAIETILNALEKAMIKYPRKDPRHRIEHSAMMTSGLMERIKKLGIIPVPQPVFLYEFGDGYMVNYGKERAYSMFPCGSFLKNDIIAAGSSDCPITFSDPFLNMYMAVNRKTQTGQVINEDECISAKDALRMFTYNGAYASFEEDKKGSIEVGKLADMVVISDDILKVPKEKIKDIRAEMTIIDGEIVYSG